MTTLKPPTTTDDGDDLFTRALADLDAAPDRELSTEQRSRAETTLARVLASEPAATPAPATYAPLLPYAPLRSPRRRFARPLLLAAAALALTLAISMSGLLGTGGTAYATWTPRPTATPIEEQGALARECQDELASSARRVADQGQDTDIPAGSLPTASQLEATRLVLADTRGDWSLVVLEGADGLEATCLTGGSGGGLFGSGWATSAGSFGFTAPPAPDPDRIVGSEVMASSADEGSYWATRGRVGSEVAGVTVVTRSGEQVEATVVGDHFAAWWPERVDLGAADGETDPVSAVRYVITYSDGTRSEPLSYEEISPWPLG